jgi:hypothetical protein
MKIFLEVDVDDKYLSILEDGWRKNGMKTINEEKIKSVIGNKICGIINNLIVDETMDHNEFIPEIGEQRWIDIIGDISVSTLQNIRDAKLSNL